MGRDIEFHGIGLEAVLETVSIECCNQVCSIGSFKHNTWLNRQLFSLRWVKQHDKGFENRDLQSFSNRENGLGRFGCYVTVHKFNIIVLVSMQ